MCKKYSNRHHLLGSNWFMVEDSVSTTKIYPASDIKTETLQFEQHSLPWVTPKEFEYLVKKVCYLEKKICDLEEKKLERVLHRVQEDP